MATKVTNAIAVNCCAQRTLLLTLPLESFRAALNALDGFSYRYCITPNIIMVLFLLLNFITTAAVVGNVVADPVGARVAASPKGGGGEATLNNRNGLLSFDKLYFGDTPLVATTVRVSPHDAEAIVPNARVAHGPATAAREHESKCVAPQTFKGIFCRLHLHIRTRARFTTRSVEAYPMNR